MTKTKANRNPQYAALKARLVERHSSLRQFAIANNIPVGTVYLSARGLRNGPRAKSIRTLLENL